MVSKKREGGGDATHSLRSTRTYGFGPSSLMLSRTSEHFTSLVLRRFRLVSFYRASLTSFRTS